MLTCFGGAELFSVCEVFVATFFSEAILVQEQLFAS